MPLEPYREPFSVCFNIMKIKYTDYERTIDSKNFLHQDDGVNVFINFESVMNYLSMIKDLDSKLLLERRFPIILESNMINLCAHYRNFFKSNGLDTRVYLYYTDLASEEFKNFSYNDEYRSYYIMKYTQNPKFQILGNRLVSDIVPRVQKILEYINDAYFLVGHGIEGSLLPLIVASQDKTRKNFLISADRYDMQYMLYPNFQVHYLKKHTGGRFFTNFDDYIKALITESMSQEIIETLKNHSFYSLLMCAEGDKHRSIEPLRGAGYKTVLKYILDGIKAGYFTKSTSSLEMLLKSIPDEAKEDASIGFRCINFENQWKDLGSSDIFNITEQIVNRSDMNALEYLNQNDYADFQLRLDWLSG